MSHLADRPHQETTGTAARVGCHQTVALSDGWEAAACTPDLHSGTGAPGGASWIPARVPGTAAAALRDAGLWHRGATHDFDAEDWWFRLSFSAEPVAPSEEVYLRLDGLATVAEVYLNGELVLESDSMFARHSLDVGALLRNTNELVIRCRALGPLLAQPRRPRARWRTRIVSKGNLRFFRTMLLGRAPGFASGPATVGPWRPVWLERRRSVVVEHLQLRTSTDDEDGLLFVTARVRTLDGTPVERAEIECSGPSGTHRETLTIDLHASADETAVRGEVRVANVARWWPHTHGDPALYTVGLTLHVGGESVGVDAGRVGFRKLVATGALPGHDVERDGVDMHVNDVPVFIRGAVWTPLDLIGMAPPAGDLRRALVRVRDAGMNMLRLPGTGAYETSTFHDICDELGILVWQDFMFANFDYPIGDASLRAAIEHEVDGVLQALAQRPSLAVLCGNSEVEQQVAMTGLDPSLGRNELFGELLPSAVESSGVDAAYVPSAPCGGDLPFRPDRGVANYYGVGCYLRPLDDARRSGLRFASECLAFANVPDDPALALLNLEGGGRVTVQGPAWKTGVPRDAGASWDFDDVRDHYLQLLFGVDARALRTTNEDRYLELSRQVSGEVMAETFGEWRRRGSSCRGALVLWMQDVAPGAGWGLLDCTGEPKAVYYHLKRALAPVAVWTVDEGLGGIAVHAANDLPMPLSARLRVALYRNLEQKVHEAHEMIEIPPHRTCERSLERLLGYFVDASCAYRFGPPGHDLIVASLEQDTEHGWELLSQSARFPTGRPAAVETAANLGLQARARELADGSVTLSVRSKRLAYGVRVRVPGCRPDDDAFCVEPGGERTLVVRPQELETAYSGAALSALNLNGRLPIEIA